jgi:hypothetical protein
MSELDKIKERIQNLLNKTVKNGATRAEAESSLAKANELMTKYMIEKHDLEDYKLSDCIRLEVKIPRRDSCLTTLYGLLAYAFDCEFFYRKRLREGTFFGYSVDIQMCSYLYDVVTNSLLSEIKRFKGSRKWAEYKSQGCSSQEMVTDFVRGFCAAISRRLLEMREERVAAVYESTGTNLVVLKAESVAQELGRIEPNIKEAKSSPPPAPRNNCYRDGAIKGHEVELNKALQTKETDELCQR